MIWALLIDDIDLVIYFINLDLWIKYSTYIKSILLKFNKVYLLNWVCNKYSFLNWEDNL
jgi:hypothetical protein